ncbi:MAG: hypothetical protein [Chaetfec virus UA24_144]|nr:MAG: hypothetical protein [Chaetfec virus UA24_144]
MPDIYDYYILELNACGQAFKTLAHAYSIIGEDSDSNDFEGELMAKDDEILNETSLYGIKNDLELTMQEVVARRDHYKHICDGLEKTSEFAAQAKDMNELVAYLANAAMDICEAIESINYVMEQLGQE